MIVNTIKRYPLNILKKSKKIFFDNKTKIE